MIETEHLQVRDFWCGRLMEGFECQFYHRCAIAQLFSWRVPSNNSRQFEVLQPRLNSDQFAKISRTCCNKVPCSNRVPDRCLAEAHPEPWVLIPASHV
jgi:hypothetical protein